MEDSSNQPGVWLTSDDNDRSAIVNWLMHHKYGDRRLIPQLYCPLSRQFNERTIQELQSRQIAAEWSQARAKH